MRGTRFVTGIAVMLWFGTVVVPAGASDEAAPSLDRLAEFVETRSALSLPADPDFVTDLLLTSVGDPGLDAYGFPLTMDEVAVIDARVTRQTASAAFIDSARSVEGFAGAYYDHRRDGAFVLLLVDPSAETVDVIRAAFPPDAGELIIENAGRSYETLVDAAKRLWELKSKLMPGSHSP